VLADSTKNEGETFKFDLCWAIFTSNIPLNKLSNTGFETFLEKYCIKGIPEKSTIRRKFYAETTFKIKTFNNWHFI
jgi:hypothetical protein